MDEAWAPQKKDEQQQQIMWLNKLPPGVKIPLTAEQMAKVVKMVKLINSALLISTFQFCSSAKLCDIRKY